MLSHVRCTFIVFRNRLISQIESYDCSKINSRCFCSRSNSSGFCIVLGICNLIHETLAKGPCTKSREGIRWGNLFKINLYFIQTTICICFHFDISPNSVSIVPVTTSIDSHQTASSISSTPPMNTSTNSLPFPSPQPPPNSTSYCIHYSALSFRRES